MFFPAAAVTTLASDPSGWATALLVLSHLPLIVDLPLLLICDVPLLAAYDAALLLFSMAYHVARASGTAFGLTVDAWRTLDHVTATSAPAALGLTVLTLDRGGGLGGTFARTLLPFVVLFAITAYPMQPQALVVVLVFLVFTALARLLFQTGFRVPTAPPGGFVDWRWFTAMVVLVLAGGALFYLPDADYTVAHALWHIFIGAALPCGALAFTKNRRRMLPLFQRCWAACRY
jgi:predicted membrane channel-forming protein YqfA (hemolysin III family)